MLDLGDLDFIDSSGLRAITILAKRLDGRRIVLRRPRGEVRKVLEVVRYGDLPGIGIEVRE